MLKSMISTMGGPVHLAGGISLAALMMGPGNILGILELTAGLSLSLFGASVTVPPLALAIGSAAALFVTLAVVSLTAATIVFALTQFIQKKADHSEDSKPLIRKTITLYDLFPNNKGTDPSNDNQINGHGDLYTKPLASASPSPEKTITKQSLLNPQGLITS